MKNFKLLTTVAFFSIIVLLLTSCGMTRINDFSRQKYTNFKKGESTVNIKKIAKQKNVAIMAQVAPEKIEIAATTIVADNTPKTIVSSITGIRQESKMSISNTNTVTKETNIEKAKQVIASVNTKLGSKASTTSYDRNGDGLSLFWVVILIVLVLWALGLLAGLGGLINILLVIALVLLILWLLEII